ncbi:MAG: hypothetical protein ACR65R_18435 [Methylomicrobium sp.]
MNRLFYKFALPVAVIIQPACGNQAIRVNGALFAYDLFINQF